MALRAYWQQTNRHGVLDRIEIHDSQFSGTAFQMKGDATGFSFRHDEITSESNEKLINIQKNRVQVGKLDFRPRIENTQGFTLLEDIRDSSNNRFHIVHKVDGAFEWCGNITTRIFSYPEKANNFFCHIRATDFEALQGGNDYPLDDSRQTLLATLADLFSELPEEVPIKTATSWVEENVTGRIGSETYDFLAEIYHDTKALREFGRTGDEADQPISKFEALERVAECGLLIRQHRGYIYVDQLTELADPTTVHETIYNGDGSVNTATRPIDRRQTGYASIDGGTPVVKVTSQNDTYPAVGRVETTFDHRSKVSGLLLPNAVYLSNNEDESFSNTLIVTGNEEISLSASVFVRHSTDEDGAYGELQLRVGQYYFNGTNWVQDSSAVVTVSLTGEGEQVQFDGSADDYYQYDGSVSIDTPALPPDATSPVEVTFRNGLVEANPDVVADRTIYENISYSVTDPGNTEENSTSINYRLSQTGADYPTTINLEGTYFGDWARGTAAALRHSIANADTTSTTWRRRGQAINYRLFHENLLKEVVDMGRTNMRKLEANIWGDYDPSRVLDYNGSYFYYAGGRYDGTTGRWTVTLMELDLQTGSDDFQDIPKFTDGTGSGSGSSGSSGGGGMSQPTADNRYPLQSNNASDFDDIPAVRENLGLEIGSDVQAHSTHLDTYVESPLTATELDELQNIGDTTISAAQWQYVGNLDQGLSTNDDPTFDGLTLTDTLAATDGVFSEDLTVKDDLFVEGGLFAKEFTVEQTLAMFDYRMSVGGGKIEAIAGSEGSETITFADPENQGLLPCATDDILLIQQYAGSGASGAIIKQVYRRVASTDGMEATLTTSGLSHGTADDVGALGVGDFAVVVGNTSDSTRDHYIHFDVAGAEIPSQKFFDGVDDVGGGFESLRIGGMSGFDSSINGEMGIAGKTAADGAVFWITEQEARLTAFTFNDKWLTDGQTYIGKDMWDDLGDPDRNNKLFIGDPLSDGSGSIQARGDTPGTWAIMRAPRDSSDYMFRASYEGDTLFQVGLGDNLIAGMEFDDQRMTNAAGDFEVGTDGFGVNVADVGYRSTSYSFLEGGSQVASIYGSTNVGALVMSSGSIGRLQLESNSDIYLNPGIGNRVRVAGDTDVNGDFSAYTKDFRIPHPNPDLTSSYDLHHSTVESPTGGDNLYRYTIEATEADESVFIKLPDYFKYLNRDVDVHVSPGGHFGRAWGTVNANDLKVKCEAPGTYHVIVIGTRKDPHAVEAWEGAVRETN